MSLYEFQKLVEEQEIKGVKDVKKIDVDTLKGYQNTL